MSRATFDRIALWTARIAVGGLMFAAPGAFFLVLSFTEEWTSKPNMMGDDVWGPRLFFAFLLGLGLALLLTPPEKWFKLPRWPGSRRR